MFSSETHIGCEKDSRPQGCFDPEDCSAIIVGKSASATGKVLFGHNEDDGGENVMIQYRVPRKTHEAGETIAFEPSCAKIPQVKETWAYIWSETRASWQASFSDTFVNEWGVAIASDSCYFSREDNPDLLDGGIGYGLGHLIAQRARTAREGVEIAADLLDTYGYAASGRAYEIVDKDEGWVLQVVKGKHYVAKRVPDDEVMFIPNWYTIHGVDLGDKENCLASQDLVTYAMKRGWYAPKTHSDSISNGQGAPLTHDDFDFALAYQDPTQNQKGNILRHRNALRLILGKEPEDIRAFSVKPKSIMNVEDVKTILRSHYEGTDDDLSCGYEINPHKTGNRTICTGTTLESFIVEFNEDPIFTCIWRATLNPCTSPYVPWFLGINKIPGGYGFLDSDAGFRSHFNVQPGNLTFRPGRAWWAFQNVQDLADAFYPKVIHGIQSRRQSLENAWIKEQTQVMETAKSLYAVDKDKCRAFLTDYTEKQAFLAWRTWERLFKELLTALDEDLVEKKK